MATFIISYYISRRFLDTEVVEFTNVTEALDYAMSKLDADDDHFFDTVRVCPVDRLGKSRYFYRLEKLSTVNNP